MLSVPASAERAGLVSPYVSGRLVGAGLIAITLLACVAMLEAGLRAIGRYRLDSVDGYFAAEGLSYGLKKNVTKRVYWPSSSFLVQTDEFGFRAAQTGPRHLAGKPYYAVIGASDAFGNGLDYDKTFVGVFARRMAAAHQAEVVNLAVGGHHLMEQVARFREFTSKVPTPPKAVIITLNPLMIAGSDDINAGVVVRKGELFEQDNWRIPLIKMMLSNSSAAYSFFHDGIRNVQLRYFNRPDFSLDFYLYVYSKELRIRTPEGTADFEARMAGLEQDIRGLGASPVCVYSPATGGFLLNKLQREGKLDGSRFDTQFFQDLARRHCTAAGIPFVDFEPMLQERYDRGEKLNFDLDAHFNEPTSRAIGDYLYEALKP
jgi:hypothetical protein